jgi:hydrogenase expression/formation protein HypE
VIGDAAVIGRVSSAEPKGMVSMRTSIGGERLVDMPWGEILPRIC